MRLRRKIALIYCDSDSRETQRVIWPAAIGYFEAARMLIGWCELRQDFRSFRVDRIRAATFLKERFPGRPADLRARWFAARVQAPRERED
jgi:predicted DNA-binding transcriptional regulator YafY